jgi:hypothetical protein
MNPLLQQYPRLFCKFHREVFCWIDRWHGLTMTQIREIEEEVKRELDAVAFHSIAYQLISHLLNYRLGDLVSPEE